MNKQVALCQLWSFYILTIESRFYDDPQVRFDSNSLSCFEGSQSLGWSHVPKTPGWIFKECTLQPRVLFSQALSALQGSLWPETSCIYLPPQVGTLYTHSRILGSTRIPSLHCSLNEKLIEPCFCLLLIAFHLLSAKPVVHVLCLPCCLVWC